MKYSILFYPAVCAFSLLLSSCNDDKQQNATTQSPQAVPVTVLITPQPKEVTVQADLPGRLEAFRVAEVRARVAGIILRKAYQEGQSVQEGELLFTIDPAPYQAEYEVAEATLAKSEAAYLNAEDKAKIYTDLISKNAVSKRDYTDAVMEGRKAKAEVLAAKAYLQQAKLRLDYTRVTAPIAGQARRAFVTEGALVGMVSPTPLTIVEQIDPIYVKFTQPASSVMAMRQAILSGRWKGVDPRQTPISLKLADGSIYEHTGKLVFSDLAVDPGTDTVEMRAEFPNPNKELFPGGSVHVEYEKAVKKNVILIPKESLMITPRGAIVLGLSPDNTVIPIPVEVDGMEESNWQVIGGLKPGTKVIVERILMATFPGAKAVITRTIKDLAELSQAPAVAPSNPTAQ